MLLDKYKNIGFNFKNKKNKEIYSQILPGFSYKIWWDGCLDEADDVGHNIYSDRYAKFIDTLFSDADIKASDYMQRLLANDTEGCIAFASVGIVREDSDDSVSFVSGRVELSEDDFLYELSRIESVDDLFTLLFNKWEFRFLGSFDLFWVHFYFLLELNKNCEEILYEMTKGGFALKNKNNKKIDVQFIEKARCVLQGV